MLAAWLNCWPPLKEVDPRSVLELYVTKLWDGNRRGSCTVLAPGNGGVLNVPCAPVLFHSFSASLNCIIALREPGPAHAFATKLETQKHLDNSPKQQLSFAVSDSVESLAPWKLWFPHVSRGFL